MSAIPEAAWPFDPYVHAVAHYEGYPVIRSENPGKGVIGGVSFIHPKLPALTLDPRQNPKAYRHLVEMVQARWQAAEDGPPRQQLLDAVADTVTEALPFAPEQYDAYMGSVAGKKTVDLSHIMDANAGDGRSQALAAAFLVQALAPHFPVGVDQGVVHFPDGAFPHAWARYRDLGDALTSSFFRPLATVIVSPLQETADTLWATWSQNNWSPYARAEDEAQLWELSHNRVLPVVRDMIQELGHVASEAQPRASFLVTDSGVASPYFGTNQGWHIGQRVVRDTGR